MGDRLVREATKQSPVTFIPLGGKCMVFPVEPDEERPVDIHIVKQGQELPDMGVVCAVSFDLNDEAVRRAQEAEDRGEADMAMAILRAKAIQVGDIVAMNKFSGMDVPGTSFTVIDHRDLLGKVFGLPVRLRTGQQRWDDVQKRREDHEARERAEALAVPSGQILKP